MRWPFMLKKTHEAEFDQLTAIYQEMADAEYARAVADGRAKVHAWAIEANYNVFNHGNARSAAIAAFQEAEELFAPSKIDIKEVLSA